ncbi:MAG: glycosyltransferase family 39 protein [Candidatus Poribacteria bacterium]|nr:glycosyltransferase family 39 protein [Candidatus Poribacteria bacterium]
MIFENSNAKSKSILIKIILFCILITSFTLVLRNLGHSKIHYWDEGFHAMVARNLTKHPLKFTLYDQPWLEYNYKSWGENHIWLHKPPVAMWKICISHFIFGINAFALRLPSAISLVLSAWLTYRIASDLFDKRAGLIAAFLQAFNPFLFESVHGYRFSDHIDIALLLWVQVSCWFLLRGIRSGKRRNYILSGVAMGIAYLSKSYLALITFGIAFVVWFVAWYKRRSRIHGESTDEPSTVEQQESDHAITDGEDLRIRLSDVGLQLLVGILTVAPWAIYCLIKYPQEFLWEHKRVIDHLNTNVENWAASWDRPLFEYMPLFYPFFYAALFAVVLCLLVVMFKRWRLPELFVLAWAIGVIVPHVLAETKTPSATMIAVPPLLICIAAVISRAWQRRDWFYTAIWGASMLSIVAISFGSALVHSGKWLPGTVSNRGIGFFQFDGIRSFAPFIHKHFWIIEQLIIFGVLLAFFVGIFLISKREWQKWISFGVRIVALVIAIFCAGRYVHAAYRVTERNAQIPLYVVSGERIQRELPENVCFFLDDERTGAHFDLMYYADRSTYQINNVHAKSPRNVARQAKEAREAGAIPYLFSVKETEYSYPLLMEGEVDVGNDKKQRYRIFEITER